MTTSSLICVISIASSCDDPGGKPPASSRLPPRARTKRSAQAVSAGTHALTGSRILMLGHARVLGHVFNPLTVFWCHHADGTLAAVIAEVHNTYRQRHAYLLNPDDRGRAEAVKNFYVSLSHLRRRLTDATLRTSRPAGEGPDERTRRRYPTTHGGQPPG